MGTEPEMRTKRYLQTHVVYQRTEMILRNPLASPVRGARQNGHAPSRAFGWAYNLPVPPTHTIVYRMAAKRFCRSPMFGCDTEKSRGVKVDALYPRFSRRVRNVLTACAACPDGAVPSLSTRASVGGTIEVTSPAAATATSSFC